MFDYVSAILGAYDADTGQQLTRQLEEQLIALQDAVSSAKAIAAAAASK